MTFWCGVATIETVCAGESRLSSSTCRSESAEMQEQGAPVVRVDENNDRNPKPP